MRNEQGQFVKGIVPWNKDKVGVMPIPWNKGKTGFNVWNKGLTKDDPRVAKYSLNVGSKKTQFKKQPHSQKLKFTPSEYRDLHYNLRKVLGNPTKCNFCNSPNNLEWANKSHMYHIEDLTDWISLCVKCHRRYDREYNEKLEDVKNG